MAAVEFGVVNKLNELFQDPGYPISAGQLPPNQAIVMIEVDQTRMFGGAKFENGHADEILLPGAKDRVRHLRKRQGPNTKNPLRRWPCGLNFGCGGRI